MPVTRRDFLRNAATAVGAVSVPTIIPSSALGADGKTAPSERLAVGLIGMGKLCQGHLGSFLGDSSVHVAAVCDVEADRLEDAKNTTEARYAEAYEKGSYKGCTAYRDFRELVARPDVDAVLIATPTNWHALMAIEACKAGKDVYCEKPLALTIAEARATAEAAKQYGRVFQTGSQQRSDGTFRFACELVRNGRIGKVHTVHVDCGGPSGPCYLPAMPTPESLDWDLWLGPAPYRPYNSELCPFDNFATWPNWRGYWDYDGGGMTDMGAHHFDIAQWGLGMDGSGPVEITPPDGKDVKLLTYKYADGTALYHGGAMPGAAIEFIGTEGRVGVNRGSFLKTEPESLRDEAWGPADLHLYDSRSHKDNWLDCIRTRRQPICPAEVGCSSVTVCHLGNLAYWLKRPLKWDPAKATFVDDAGANRMLQRAMRPPWRS